MILISYKKKISSDFCYIEHVEYAVLFSHMATLVYAVYEAKSSKYRGIFEERSPEK